MDGSLYIIKQLFYFDFHVLDYLDRYGCDTFVMDVTIHLPDYAKLCFTNTNVFLNFETH